MSNVFGSLLLDTILNISLTVIFKTY